jgi:chromosomal replication initiator protein
LSVQDLIGQNRSAKFAVPRQMVMYILREFNEVSLPQIGELLGGRDHTTVMHGINKVRADEKLKKQVENMWQNFLNQPVAI